MNDGEFTYQRYGTFAERAQKFSEASSIEKPRLLYMWTKQGVVSLKQFNQLLAILSREVG